MAFFGLFLIQLNSIPNSPFFLIIPPIIFGCPLPAGFLPHFAVQFVGHHLPGIHLGCKCALHNRIDANPNARLRPRFMLYGRPNWRHFRPIGSHFFLGKNLPKNIEIERFKSFPDYRIPNQ
jgi:hypothetical protein